MSGIRKNRCEYNGCKEKVYMDGLCYDHYMDMLEAEQRGKKDKSEILPAIVSFTSVVFLVSIWIVLSGSAVEFGLNSYRYSSANIVFFTVPPILIIAASYLLARGIMWLIDNISFVKYVFVVIMLVFFAWILLNYTELFPAYKDFLRNLAGSYTGWIGSLR